MPDINQLFGEAIHGIEEQGDFGSGQVRSDLLHKLVEFQRVAPIDFRLEDVTPEQLDQVVSEYEQSLA